MAEHMNKHNPENITHQYGLVGYPIGHSFSARYFEEKFARSGLNRYSYQLFEIKNISNIRKWGIGMPFLRGFNVTIPHKTAIMPFLDAIDDAASEIGAVNCVRIKDNFWTGFNTDVTGFEASLNLMLQESRNSTSCNTLILGNGGSSRAVQWVLAKKGWPFTIVSRTRSVDTIQYQSITPDIIRGFDLIINTTPLGMYPATENAPDIPYHALNHEQMLMDLIYNPDKTLFLRHGENQGCRIMNGMHMLTEQAEASWILWNN